MTLIAELREVSAGVSRRAASSRCTLRIARYILIAAMTPSVNFWILELREHQLAIGRMTKGKRCLKSGWRGWPKRGPPCFRQAAVTARSFSTRLHADTIPSRTRLCLSQSPYREYQLAHSLDEVSPDGLDERDSAYPQGTASTLQKAPQEFSAVMSNSGKVHDRLANHRVANSSSQKGCGFIIWYALPPYAAFSFSKRYSATIEYV
ncbi:hypothetical protein BDV95DRAFT_291643 [Massariosphaeria phaeospora]|uniref:Uncharacterized protein n=1 Tax=Massariosphaeria phaeospora TaxID=100035 RepID=A0A7C8ME52_9PLEO|nr:hypothetical protein BDV95DRAFT_291643 [Massariosphaeria phaeospora]